MLDGLTGFGRFAVSAMPLDDPSRENIRHYLRVHGQQNRAGSRSVSHQHPARAAECAALFRRSSGMLSQKSHGQISSRPVVSKSGKFRVAKRPPLIRAMAAIIPSGAVIGRPCLSAALMMSP